jgi:hypothetical protein
MRSIPSLTGPGGTGFLFLILGLFLVTPAAQADIDFAILPSVISVDPGEIFDVELTITQTGSAFNAYDAVVGFDPDVLTFIPLSDTEQQGPLMTDACGNIYHVFNVSPFGDTLEISQVLLCSATDVSGPGVVYRLRFQAGDQNETTSLSLLDGTLFALAGLYVTPVITHDAQVSIGPVSPVPEFQGTPTANLQAAPNPFNPATTISFDAPAAMSAKITIYSSRGFRIAGLLNGQVSPGRNSVLWDGRDNQGSLVGSGVYLVQLELGAQSFTRRISLVK